MNSKKSHFPPEYLPPKTRLLAVGMVFFLLFIGAVSAYWMYTSLFPIYGRIYRAAPVVEVPYMAFGLLMTPPAFLLGIVTSVVAAWTGRRVDPPKGTYLHQFEGLTLKICFKTTIYLIPAAIILTTGILLIRDYTPCPKLLISGSAWQLFWVNDERVCFKPDHYINDHWPCKKIDDKSVCIQVDGR